MASVFETTPEYLPAPADTDSVEKWDSLGHLMLIESIEVAFAVTFDHAETLDMLSEDDVLAHLAERIAVPTIASTRAT
jgi:acyl carrier protein